ncbi:hypothetical protein ABIB25_002206 [Nakamurella sp. UYEF19]|uniref:hypothetical protein n=1 Tax=Nakamurella sp. UYEF19 TaxID=1756392 RepID=UPI00339267D2
MDRRWAGLVVLAVVLLAAVVVPQLTPRRLAGTAVTVPVPPPPSVGDCLLKPVDPDQQVRAPDHAAVSTGPCAGPRYGEVVSVLPVAAEPAFPQDGSDGPPVDPNVNICAQDVIGYLGLGSRPGHPGDPTIFGHPASLFTYWSPVVLSSFLFVAGPDALQRTMGQQWIACVSYVPDPVSRRATHYDHTVRNAFRDGAPPANYASCLRTVSAGTLDLVDCSLPHPAEIFGYTFADNTVPRSALNSTCAALTRKLTGMTDPSAGGRLTSAAVAGSGGGALSCVVTADVGHQLVGPLMNLGNGPVPLV